MDPRASTFGFALWLLLVAVLVWGGEAKEKNDTCYKPCRVKSGPVCGNDGKNYSTPCHLSVARCRARKQGQKILLKSRGFCTSSKPLSQCLLNCTSRRQPVCGSDGVSYKNLCLFKKAKCRRRKKKLSPIRVVTRRGACSVTKVKPCRKFKDCPKVRRPACGSDNKTYKNICFLKTRNCLMRRKARGKLVKRLTLRYFGTCSRGKKCSWSWQPKCPPLRLCNELFFFNGKKPSGKKRAGNLRRKNNKGKGKTKRQIRQTQKGKLKKLKGKSKGKKTKKQVLKGHKRLMVCGSDGNTYKSICHLQVYQCIRARKCQRLFMKHEGPCKRPR